MSNENLLKKMSEYELKCELEKQKDHPKRVEVIEAEIKRRNK